MTDALRTGRQPVEQLICVIRGQRVLLDFHLAGLYGIPTGRLNEQVARNRDRFPADFMFQLSKEETGHLLSQNAIARRGWGGRRTPPYAFTEQGVAMLSSVLKTARAVQVNIAIMRAFVRLREILSSHSELAAKLKELESKLEGHDEQITAIFEAIRELMARPQEEGKRIGF